MSSDQPIQYVIVQEGAEGSSDDVGGLHREELKGAIEALTQQSSLLRQRDGQAGLPGGGPQQFQIVKEDADGGTTTTTIVLVDEGSTAGGSLNLQQLKASASEGQTSVLSNQVARQDVSILADHSGTGGGSFVSNDDLIAMALGESGVSTVNTNPVTSSLITSVSGNTLTRHVSLGNTNTAPTFQKLNSIIRSTETERNAPAQIIVSENETGAVPTEFDENAVYVIDGPDGVARVVASAEELQKLVGESTSNQAPTDLVSDATKNEQSEIATGEVEEVEEEMPPRKRLRLEKKMRNCEFLFRRRKRDMCAKMRQYEAEFNKITRENNSLQQKINDKKMKVYKVEEQIDACNVAIARAKGIPV